MMSLTAKQEKFCQEIVRGRNQSDAYRSAFNAKRLTTKSVHELASRTMALVKVMSRIDELRAPVVESVRLTMQRRLEEVAHAAMLDPGELYDENDQPLPIRSIPEHVRRAIAGVEADAEKFTTKIKFVDKLAAIHLDTKLKGDLPTERGRSDEKGTAPGLVNMSQFASLPLSEKLAMRQKLLAVMQEYAAPRFVNE